jgi:hypothetical protein
VDERRNSTRVPSQLEARWESNNRGAQPAKVRDLSQGGAFMHGDLAAERGDEARLTMITERGSEVAVRARVVRTVTGGSGFGVRFVGMDLNARRAIANLLLCRTAFRKS